MKTLIETYRGWEIFFDTEKEEFYTTSNEHDKEQTKKSYPACKKYIDDFIKDNVKFVPFYVVPVPERIRYKADKLKIVGIRKDNAYVYENSKGERVQFNSYNMTNYMLEDERNKPFIAEIEKLENKAEEIRQQIKEAEKKFFVKTLKQHRDESI
jgi:hypothetical protein